MYELVIDFESENITIEFVENIKRILGSMKLPNGTKVNVAMVDEQHVEILVKTPSKIGQGLAKLKDCDPQDVADFLEYQILDGLGLGR